jgi:2-hydroxychromene-2-carboxylate isomerase
MKQPVELFYDFKSPYSYLTFTQLRQMEVGIALRPIQVLQVMEKVGNVPTTITRAAKGRYARTDLTRWAKRYSPTLRPSNMRKNNGDACARAALAADPAAQAAAIALVLFRVCWSECKILATPDDILTVLAANGVDIAFMAGRIAAPEIAAKLDANINEAAERGVFGAPTIFVGDAMIFGNDRLDFVREEFARLEQTA